MQKLEYFALFFPSFFSNGARWVGFLLLGDATGLEAAIFYGCASKETGFQRIPSPLSRVCFWTIRVFFFAGLGASGWGKGAK